jgi:hypothetical protein
MAADPQVYRPVPGVERSASACFVGQRYADRDRWMAALIQAGVPVDIYGPGWGAASGAASAASGKAASEVYLGRTRRRPGSAAAYAEALRDIGRREGFLGGALRVARQWRRRRETHALAPLFMPSAKGPLPFQQIATVFSAYDLCLNFSNVWADGQPGSDLIPHVRLRDFEAPMCGACYLTGHTDEITEFYEVGQEIDTYRSAGELVDKARFYLAHPQAAARLREAGHRRALRDHTWQRRFGQLFRAVFGGNSS